MKWNYKQGRWLCSHLAVSDSSIQLLTLKVEKKSSNHSSSLIKSWQENSSMTPSPGHAMLSAMNIYLHGLCKMQQLSQDTNDSILLLWTSIMFFNIFILLEIFLCRTINSNPELNVVSDQR